MQRGNAGAVTEIFNYLLITDGVKTETFFNHGVVEVIVKGEEIPTPDKLIQRISQIIEHLQLTFITKVKIYAQHEITEFLIPNQDFKPMKK